VFSTEKNSSVTETAQITNRPNQRPQSSCHVQIIFYLKL